MSSVYCISIGGAKVSASAAAIVNVLTRKQVSLNSVSHWMYSYITNTKFEEGFKITFPPTPSVRKVK